MLILGWGPEMRIVKNIFVLLLLISSRALSQSNTPNIGFENGTFDNWQCYIGHIDPLGVISVSPSPPVYDRQTIIGNESAKTRDPYGKFPILCPNGSKYSVRLGNKDTSAQAERLTYTFTVPSDRAYSIIFDYAVVLQNPPHLPFEQPKFTAQVYDLTDNKYIDCPSFNFVASSNLPGFKLSTVSGARGESIYYKDWSTATIDLRGYLGKTLRLEFTTNDCSRGGHFGYAYIDVNDNSGTPITGNAYCAGQNSVTLFAPNGFAAYQWYNADMSQQIGFGQSLTISPPPPDLSTYAVKIFPYLGLGCVDTLFTVINKIDEGFKLSVTDTLFGCPGEGVDLTAAAVTAGSSAGMTLTYFNDALATSYLYDPNLVMATGVYYIKGVNTEGCMNILPVQVIVDNPPLVVTDPSPVVFPVSVDLSKTFAPQYKVVYTYYTNAAATIPVPDYKAIRYGGIYYIKAVNRGGCVTIAPVNVVIHPPPPYDINAPNTFTPNNDGINDHFIVTIAGQATFVTISVYSRNGQLVFTSKSPDEYWDGKLNGSNLPTGTYYWVLAGTDNYYRTSFSRAGSITLLR